MEHTFPFHPCRPSLVYPTRNMPSSLPQPFFRDRAGVIRPPGTSPLVDALLIVEAEKTWQRASSSGPALIQLTRFLFSAWRAGRSGESMRLSHRGSLAGQVTQAPLLQEAWLHTAPASRAMCIKLPVCVWHSVLALYFTFLTLCPRILPLCKRTVSQAPPNIRPGPYSAQSLPYPWVQSGNSPH